MPTCACMRRSLVINTRKPRHNPIEVKVTGLVNQLMDLALAESDHASCNFLQWFVGEQVEEEATADEVVQKLRLVDKTEGGLFLLDQEMDKRTFVMPADLAGVF